MPPERSRTLAVGTRDELTTRVVREVTAAAARAIGSRGRFTLAIAGGSVASTFLPRLAVADIPWSSVDIFWCDERAVPLDDPESNAGQALALLKNTPMGAHAVLHVMTTTEPASDAALDHDARQYAALLERISGTPVVLDLVLLGVGEDGHIASLFPDRASLNDTGSLVLPITDSPKPPPRRLTLTLPVLTHARRVIVATFGDSKAFAMQQALEDAASRLPVALVWQRSEHISVLLDAAAASRLHSAPARVS
jgi:6-phosphogluconolactonase